MKMPEWLKTSARKRREKEIAQIQADNQRRMEELTARLIAKRRDERTKKLDAIGLDGGHYLNQNNTVWDSSYRAPGVSVHTYESGEGGSYSGAGSSGSWDSGSSDSGSSDSSSSSSD